MLPVVRGLVAQGASFIASTHVTRKPLDLSGRGGELGERRVRRNPRPGHVVRRCKSGRGCFDAHARNASDHAKRRNQLRNVIRGFWIPRPTGLGVRGARHQARMHHRGPGHWIRRNDTGVDRAVVACRAVPEPFFTGPQENGFSGSLRASKRPPNETCQRWPRWVWRWRRGHSWFGFTTWLWRVII